MVGAGLHLLCSSYKSIPRVTKLKESGCISSSDSYKMPAYSFSNFHCSRFVTINPFKDVFLRFKEYLSIIPNRAVKIDGQ